MKYGFIGCGNMGGAIARMLSSSTKSILVSDRTGKAKQLADSCGIGYADSVFIAEDCERIFLAVKPQMMEAALTPVRKLLAERAPLIITMAAGLEIRRIEDLIGAHLPVIRIMPNTPTALGKGVIPYCCNELVRQEALEDWLRDMTPCGLLDPLEERLMDAVGAVSGSGPAYLYLMMEALADGAVACGIPREKATQYVAMTVAGAAEMVLKTGQHPGALKDAVCSPGGSTIAGVRELEARSFRSAAMECVIAAYNRNRELGA